MKKKEYQSWCGSEDQEWCECDATLKKKHLDNNKQKNEKRERDNPLINQWNQISNQKEKPSEQSNENSAH